MRLHTKTISTMLIVISLTGCSGRPILSTLGAGRQVPADAVVVSPNEQITLDVATAERTEYFCSNGAPLRCDRLNLKLYCSCPRH